MSLYSRDMKAMKLNGFVCWFVCIFFERDLSSNAIAVLTNVTFATLINLVEL